MRILAIDFGFKRIGAAVGDTGFEVVTPRAPIPASGVLKRDAKTIAALARKEEAETIVLGLPVEEDGEEGKMARICRTLASRLAEEGLTVKLVDERLSSVQAEAGLREQNLKAGERRKLRDGEAAGIILKRYLHEQTPH